MAGALSLLPGLGHWYAGKPRRAVAMLLVDVALVSGLLFSPWFIIKVFMVFLYVMSIVPAALESYGLVAGQAQAEKMSHSKLYVGVMVYFTGFWAMPLLWQTPAYSKTGKIIWTILTPFFTVAFFVLLAVYGPSMENYFQTLLP